jgi:hypothetical protein
MKNETKGSLIAVAVIMIIIAATFCCSGTFRTYDPEAVKWERFLQCSENEGDAGCDSCYFLIYGKHINPFETK